MAIHGSIWGSPVNRFWKAEFRRSSPGDKAAPVELDDLVRINRFCGIRCPLCRWRPQKSSRWTCWDCDFPEFFSGGCGTEWNTFETKGVCPTCSHRWKWTSCLACWGWSPHADWYEPEKD